MIFKQILALLIYNNVAKLRSKNFQSEKLLLKQFDKLTVKLRKITANNNIISKTVGIVDKLKIK